MSEVVFVVGVVVVVEGDREVLGSFEFTQPVKAKTIRPKPKKRFFMGPDS